jgi:hypothetical protein
LLTLKQWEDSMNKTAAAASNRSVASLFEPDILTTHQYLQVFHQKGQFEPEEKLMFAILSDAIECFQKHFGAQTRRCRALYGEVEEWIASQDSKSLFSFEHICQVLKISPSYLRLGLMQWRLAHESTKGPRKRIREPLRYQYRVRNTRMSF